MTIADPARFRATPHFRKPRARRLARVRLVLADGAAQEIMVRDVSASGLSAVAGSAPPASDAMVTVELPDGTRLWGIVRWVEGSAFGIEFAPDAQADAARMVPAARE